MLVSFTIFKEKILIHQKKEGGKKFNKDDLFVLNEGYTSRRIRVKIHTAEPIEKAK